MPIQIKAPDGSIAQFPDGMADADIEKVMAQHYPQPSLLDRAAASPVGRFAHDFGGGIVKGIMSGPDQISRMINAAIPDQSSGLPQTVTTGSPGAYGTSNKLPVASDIIDQPYEGALARNRNAPGYAAARADADKRQKPSTFTNQMIATFLPALAGIAGLPGGFDTSNANADAQTAAQEAYTRENPIRSTAAGVLGGLLVGPDGGSPAASGNFSAAAGSPADAAVAYIRRLGANPADLRAALPTLGSKPVTSAEVIGKPAEVGLGALARREGDTADALSGQMATRSASAPRRIFDDYAAASGIHPAAARGDIEAFVEANQKAAGPLYEQAYKANPNVSSPMLDRILETPAGKKALADARVKMQNDMSLMGTPDADLMAQAVEGGTALPAKGAASGMKLRVYDYVKRSLNDQTSAAYRAGNKDEGNIIRDLNKSLVKALDEADVTSVAGPNSLKPEGGMYAQARAKAGEYLSAKKQFEEAQSHILDDKFPAQDMAAYVAKLGPAEKQAYTGGVANRLFALQQAGKLKASVFRAPIVQSKLATLMGPDKARAFIQNMVTEQKMAEFSRLRAPGAGSPTAEYNAAMKDQDGASSLAMDGIQVAGDAARHGLIPAIGNLAINKGKDLAAGYLTRGMAIPVRNEAGRLLMLPPADLATYLDGIPQLPRQPPLQLPRLPARGALPYGLGLTLPQSTSSR